MKKIKYLLLLLFIVLLTPNAYAYTYDVTNNITAMSGSGSTGGHYLGLEIYNSGSQNNYTVNTRYNGTLSNIEFNLPLPAEADECFTTNMEYTVTMEMATSDWRNHFARPYVGADSSSTNWAISNVTFVSMKKIYFKFKIPATESLCYGFVYVRLSSPSVSDTAFTGVTNWNLSKITLSDQYSSSGGGSSGGSTPPTPTANPNQNIIDSNNENTNNIIENNNQNTQSIIDNQNELMGNKCKNLFNNFLRGAYNSSTGAFDSSNNATYATAKIPATSGSKYVIKGFANNTLIRLLYWNGNTFVSTELKTIGSTPLVITSQGNYFAFQTGTSSSFSNLQVNEGTSPIAYCEYGTYSSKLDDTNNAISNVNDSINDDNVESGVGSDFFEDFEDNDFGLSSIITIPLNTIQSLTSKSCVALNVPIPFTNSSVPLPCMTQVYQDNIPTIYNLWKIVSFGIIAYFIAIDIFHMVKGFKDPESDKVEVLDL